MVKRLASIAAAAAVLLSAGPLGAQTVTLRLGPDASRVANQLGITTMELQNLVVDQVRGLFGLVDAPTFLRLSANAQSMANKGLGAEYASLFDHVVVGFGVNVAASAGDSDLETLKASLAGELDRAVPVAGGLQLSLMVGVKLTDALYAYVNGLAYPVSYNGLEGSGYNVGGHLQLRFASGLGSKVVAEWGGIMITTGVEVSRATFKLEQQLDNAAPLAQDFQILTATLGNLELVQKAITIPLELTTSLRLLYVATIYGGIAADFQLGAANASLALDSVITGRATSGNQSQTFDVGTARIEYSGENGADRVLFRVMTGLAANVGPLHVFGQVNLLTRDLTVGVAAGVRLTF